MEFTSKMINERISVCHRNWELFGWKRKLYVPIYSVKWTVIPYSVPNNTTEEGKIEFSNSWQRSRGLKGASLPARG